MKRKIRLTEQDMHRIVKESVNKILTEISTDTIDSAAFKAMKKCVQAYEKYGENSPIYKKALMQYEKFTDAWDNEYKNGNVARRARLLKNREKRHAGERNYIKRIGWRNGEYTPKQEQSQDTEIPKHD